ncbi:PD-(D/E)XK nuclease family protein [Haliscomenobacter hydrossis]|uniref:Uncharacterized protein n=1 Tax=Haliscomenobacter hydrossis (strain ATCC 27775 / DSM 1100 / LMG 10767 / O) TaxID=760192 RepID=F4KWA5_HALH1|nr:PD-(D/E)XK nuclease family protein [Haliscomenobacter hydrossis]AEE49293.1 hypothetical protein Halhy_1398 [Haliscomenobacter hydrossis DSM 1100]
MEIKTLLARVSDIKKCYEKIAELSGEKYNVFVTLKMHADEVKLHSAFLASLLDPKGSHGQKDIFLKLFLDSLGVTEFDTSNAEVKIEEDVGKVTEDSGGRIDIVISSGSRNILIENKIYAGDQSGQLMRYYKAYENKELFYLTLYGVDASENSVGKDSGVKYQPISYVEDILDWLNQCQKESVNHPILRETIAQYINLIKLLTNQTYSNEMKKELIDIVTENKETLNGFFELLSVSESVLESILQKFVVQISEIAQDLGLKYEEKLSITKSYSNFRFYKESWQGIRILFEFGSKNTRNFYFGLVKQENSEASEDFVAKILTTFGRKYTLRASGNSGWICRADWPKYRDWNYDVYLKIQTGVEMKEILKQKIQELLEIIEIAQGNEST